MKKYFIEGGLGSGFSGIMNSWSTYWETQTEAKAFGDAAGITDEITQRALADFVIDLKAINETQTGFIDFETPANGALRAVYPLVGTTASSQKYNLIDPQDTDGSFRIVWANDSSGAHTINGYEPNGINQYGDTKFIPFNILTYDNSHLGIYSPTNTSGTYNIGCIAGDCIFALATKANDQIINQICNGSYSGDPFCYDSRHIIFGVRSHNAELKTFFNGGKVDIMTANDPRTLPNNTVWLGGTNYSSPAYGDKIIGFASIGKAISDSAMELYDNAIYKFLRAIGRIAARSTARQLPGIAVTVDDYSNNKTMFLQNNENFIKAYGMKATSYIETAANNRELIADINALKELGIEIGTHVSILPERHTLTPEQAWTTLIAPVHNGIAYYYGVTPTSFANHDDGCEWDQDMADYLETKGYTTIREIVDMVEHPPFYDGTNVLNNAAFVYTGLIDTWPELKSVLDEVIINGKVLVFGCHGGTLDRTLLQQACAYCFANGISFFRMDELPALFA